MNIPRIMPSLFVISCMFPLLALETGYALATEGKTLECRDRKAAQEHFARGLELYEKKKLEHALPEFRHSRENCPSQNNTLNLALLLRDLGRPVDALDLLDELEQDFPTLTPENETTAKSLRKDLATIVGTAILDGDYPGATIIIDGASVGTMPMARAIRLSISMHALRVEKAGYEPFISSFTVESNKTALIAVALVPILKEPPKRQRMAKHALRFDTAITLSPTLGGQVTDCNECGGGPGLGAMMMGGYRGLLISPVRIGVIGGYTFLWQHREGSVNATYFDDLQDKTIEYSVPVNDDLFMHAFFAAPQISAEFYAANHRFDVSVALGVIGGPLVNGREPQTGANYFELDQPSRPSASFVGVMTFVQGSWYSPWRFLGRWPMLVTLGVLGIGRATRPFYTDPFREAPKPETRTFNDMLLGSWSFTFTPGLALEYGL